MSMLASFRRALPVSLGALGALFGAACGGDSQTISGGGGAGSGTTTGVAGDDTGQTTGSETSTSTTECKAGDKRCDGHTPQSCEAGQWKSADPCGDKAPYCVDGACVECSPGEVGCGALTPRTCTEKGEWQYGEACSGATPLCLDGACVACSPNATQCSESGSEVQTCDTNGAFQPTEQCMFGCFESKCTGECVPTSTRCNMGVPELCDTTGAWQSGAACAGDTPLCLNGACVACSPNATRCSGVVAQKCDEFGAWQDQETCAFTCSNGACAGMCSPGEKDCSGNVPRKCDAAGAWVASAPCQFLCVAGACTGECVPGGTTCFGAAPASCDADGKWQSQGACAQPTPECDVGACTCLHALCGGVCVNKDIDPQNCGTCAHSCDGGACNAAQCLPVQLAQAGQSADLAVDSVYVYYTNFSQDTVAKVPVTGGLPVTIASGVSTPVGIGVDANSVYFTSYNGGKVYRMGLDGSGLTALASGQAHPFALALDANNLYWTNQNGSVQQMPIGGGAVTVLASNQQTPLGIAVDGTSVYWVNGYFGTSLGTVNKVPIGGGPITTLASNQTRPTSVTVDANNVYWTVAPGSGSDAVYRCAKGGCNNFPTAIATNLQFLAVFNMARISTDDTYVYWANQGDSKVLRAPIAGGVPTVLAQQNNLQGPTSVLVDGSRVLWTAFTSGGVWKLAKPL